MKYPDIRNADKLLTDAKKEQVGLKDGRWVVPRYRGYPSFRHRCYCAWLVFTGRADALTYTGQ